MNEPSRTRITSSICYFCKGYKIFEQGEIVNLKPGRVFKCKDCLEFDKNYESTN